MIDRKLLKGLAEPLKLGQQQNFNHLDCPAGMDTRGRLYVKRVSGGILGYCHNCQEHGFVREINKEGADLRKWLRGDETVDVAEETVLTRESPGPNFRQLKEDDPGVGWLDKYGIDWEDNPNFLCPQDRNDQVVLVLRTSKGMCYGYQIRNMIDSPKYLTYRTLGRLNQDSAWFTSAKKRPCLIITEDYLSAYRVRRDADKCDALALLRTTATEATIAEILDRNYETIQVCLDPDSAGRHGSKKLVKKLKLLVPSTTGILEYHPICEPKEMTPDDIDFHFNRK